MNEARTFSAHPEIVRKALDAAGEIRARYQIAALEDFLESCRSFAGEKLLNIAILGRFKAGKSTFLNHLLGKPLLPVGVVPVTTVVTEIEYGPRERAEIHFLDGQVERVSVDAIADFISEARNPENGKRVALVRVELPSMEPYRGIRFVDTPGLESVLEHNTDASMSWLPNVGLALVAVGVDPPLSQHDVELIRNLSRYTTNISILLTKVDVLHESERIQVKNFVQKQLARCWNGSVQVFPYSVKPGFEDLRSHIDRRLLSRVARLRGKILGEKESLEDTRLALRLIVRHAAGTVRATFEEILSKDELPVKRRLLSALDREFPLWARSLSLATERFDEWLRAAVSSEMSELSNGHCEEFIHPVHRVARQLSQSLQDFRNRLSERTLEALGVPLRTMEIELVTHAPRSPDVRVGKIFDRNWELLSFLIPMALVKGSLKRHFERKVADVVFINLSRLASQWEEIVNASLLTLEKEAVRRLDSLIGTMERMITSAVQEAPRIRHDLNRLIDLRAELSRDRSRVPTPEP
ncbi:MAG: dynamin family protein [Acidobacteria bacterium]|nr:dynamin family protein [Acidobacteriota bacterium]